MSRKKIFNNVEITENAFSMDKYEKMKSTLYNGKACNEDGIKPEILNY